MKIFTQRNRLLSLRSVKIHGTQYTVYATKLENLAIHGRWRHLTPPKLLLLTDQTKLTLTDTVMQKSQLN